MLKECNKCNKLQAYGIVNTYSNGSVYAVGKFHRPWSGASCPTCTKAAKVAKGVKPLTKRKCAACTNEFTAKSAQHKYCSSRCQPNYRKPSPKKPKIVKQCYCGVEFKTYQSRAAYCSSKCRIKAQPKKLANKNCKTCATPCGRKMYCGKACRPKPKSIPKTPKARYCLSCGTQLVGAYKKYCNNPCRPPKAKRKINKESLRPYKKVARKRRKLWERRSCPKWVKSSDLVKIEKTRPGPEYHLDHIVPLRHELVCGLHVPGNLQWLSKEENEFKSNKWDGTLENTSWREQFKKRRGD